MKYSTTMEKKDMVDYINELEARLEDRTSPDSNENEQEKSDVKTYKSLSDFILDKMNEGNIDVHKENEDGDCYDEDGYGCEIDEDEYLLNEELDAAVFTILRQYSDSKTPLSYKNIPAFVDLICALEAGSENES